MSNMPGDYSTYQHNLDNDATMYDGDASTPWTAAAQTLTSTARPTSMTPAAAQTPTSTAQPIITTPAAAAQTPNVYGPTHNHDPSGGGPNPSVYGPTSIHDIDMGENTQEVWARANPLDNAQPGQSKRPRVLGSTRDELEKERQAREAANLRTRTVLREKRDAEARLVAAQREIAVLKDRMTGIDEKIKAHNADIIERVTAQWNTQVKDYTEKSEQESAARLEAELGALNAEHAKKITELNREAQKRQADYETQIAAVHSRLSAKRPGFRNPSDEMEDVEFPEGPPARPPQFVSETTRKQRVVETIIRDGSGRLPSACMTTATPPASSSTQPATGAQPPSSSSSSAETVDQSLLETLLEALGKPPVQQRVREILGTNGRKLTHDQDKRWKTIIRRNWYTDRGLPRARDFFNYEGVSEATHKGCEDGLVAPEGPTSKLYFGPGWANSLWNKKIFQHSIRRILQKRAEDPGHYDVPDKRALGGAATSRAPEETNEQARERAETYEMERRERSVGSARKMHKFQVRQETADRMLSISAAKQDGNGIETWTWLKDDLLAELDSGGMSSEEDEELEVVLPWRDAKVTDCLKVIDDASELAIAKVAAKRMRMRGSRNSTTAPPLGLPRTLYDEAWLAEQKKFIPNIEEALEISEKEFPIKEITLVQSTSNYKGKPEPPYRSNVPWCKSPHTGSQFAKRHVDRARPAFANVFFIPQVIESQTRTPIDKNSRLLLLRDRDANAQDPDKVTAAIADPSAAPPVLPGSPTANPAPVCTVHANAQDPDKVTVAITDPSEGASGWAAEAGLRHAEMLRLPYWDETRMATTPALPWYFASGHKEGVVLRIVCYLAPWQKGVQRAAFVTAISVPQLTELPTRTHIDKNSRLLEREAKAKDPDKGLAENVARLVIADEPAAPGTPLPPHAVLTEAEKSVQAILSEALNSHTKQPTRPQVTRQEQGTRLLEFISSKVQTAITSLRSADRASEEPDALWDKVDHAKGQLETVANSLKPLKETPERARVVDEMRKLESELKEFAATLPKDKRPLYYDSAYALENPIKHLDPMAQIMILLGLVCNVILGLAIGNTNFILSAVTLLIKLAMSVHTKPDADGNYSYDAMQEHILKDLPSSLYVAMQRLNVEGKTVLYAACPSCHHIHAPTLSVSTPEIESEMDEACDEALAWKRQGGGDFVDNVLHGTFIQEFVGPDGNLFIDRGKKKRMRLLFGYSFDSFPPHGSRKRSSSASIGVLYIYPLNLRLVIRHKPEHRDTIYAADGLRYSEMWRLPYWNPTRMVTPEPMHCIFEGLVAFHCRVVLLLNLNDAKKAEALPPAYHFDFLERKKQIRAIHRLLIRPFTEDEDDSDNDADSDADSDADPDGNSKDKPIHEEFTAEMLFTRLARNNKRALLFVCWSLKLRGTQWNELPIEEALVRLKKDSLAQLLVNWPNHTRTPTTLHAQRPSLRTTLRFIQEVIVKTDTPAWVHHVPKNFGEKGAGSIKADEWRLLATIYLPIALILFSLNIAWRYFKPPASLAVTATSSARSTAYRDFIKHWLGNLHDLYPHTKTPRTRTNPHVALHIYDFLLLFGPALSWWTFPIERLIGQLGKINSNDHLGANTKQRSSILGSVAQIFVAGSIVPIVRPSSSTSIGYYSPPWPQLWRQIPSKLQCQG
ncbi:hypothetical protein B0H14DRAFT_3504824 [Mycena olivaceomarginata]|nr:hypothetical protein B0H14DRAFT_3504824 [Mycena olivaceomarginata]